MEVEERRTYKILSTFTLLVLGGGMVFYHFVEKLNWVDAYYFCVVTLTTVGYGDVTPKTSLGKIFTTLYLFVGIGIITAFISTRVKIRTKKLHEKHKASEDKK